jgi:Zn-dependent membrane protease YugP
VFFDPLYLLILAPGLIVAAWAKTRLSSAYSRGSRVKASAGLTGAQAAAEIMRAEGVEGVAIESVGGPLTDHYDSLRKVLRLSPEVYAGDSLAALVIASHEAGHAAQDATRYRGLIVRNFMVPAAGIVSSAAWMMFVAGALWAFTKLVIVGMALFSAVVLFQLVNLPVEFDASRRARQALSVTGLVAPDEEPVVDEVLNATALTYVAGTLTSIIVLFFLLVKSGLVNREGR